MSEFQSSELRIADTERESALTALGEHMSSGRLDIDEYGERSARVTAAKTRGELLALFSDLPAPHPSFGGQSLGTTSPPAPAPGPAPAQVGSWESRPAVQRFVAALVPVTALAALALLFVIHTWLFFLIPAVIGAFGGKMWGDSWRHGNRNNWQGNRSDWQGNRGDYRRDRGDYRRDRRDRYRR